MSPLTVTCRRTVSRARNLITTALSVAGFLAASSALFAFRLESAEGSRQALVSIWATSVSPFLPVLAALLGMDAWSDERRTGRLDLLLSTAVRERDFVFGKTLGVWLVLVGATLLSQLFALFALAYLAPGALADFRLPGLLPAILALWMQGALWCAVSVAVSAFCRQAFAAACVTVTMLVALPRGLWAGLMAWFPSGSVTFGEMPLDAHVADFASGVLSSGVILSYLVLTLLALFIAVKTIALTRFIGRGNGGFRASTLCAMALAVLSSAAIAVLAVRLDTTLDLPVGPTHTLSPRLQQILSDSSGSLSITAFLPRKDPEFRPLARYLRGLKRQADATGGLQIVLRFVDPSWDFGPAESLVRRGAPASSLVFEKGHRLAVIPVSDGFGDPIVASAIQRVVAPPQRRDVYWTVGHGETKFDAYGTWGLSDIARELARNGYRNVPLDLSSDKTIPSDCALIVVAGAKDQFSRAELGRLDSYLRAGGRLLVLMGPSEESGVSSLLPAWGLRPMARPLTGLRTLSGTDVIVSDFAAHDVSAELAGTRLVLETPLSFAPTAAADIGAGADRLEFTALARVGSAAVVAAIERGGTLGVDLAVRPTRIVAIGDPSFVMNGQLASRANANRDFFLNVVAYLSGSPVPGASGATDETFQTGMDRAARRRFVILTALALPGLTFLMMSAVAIRRRRRK